jgi:hypothetical protein
VRVSAIDAEVLASALVLQRKLSHAYRSTGLITPWAALWNARDADGTPRRAAVRDVVDLRPLITRRVPIAGLLEVVRRIGEHGHAVGALWCAASDRTPDGVVLVTIVAETRGMGIRTWTAEVDATAPTFEISDFKAAPARSLPSVLPPPFDPVTRH